MLLARSATLAASTTIALSERVGVPVIVMDSVGVLTAPDFFPTYPFKPAGEAHAGHIEQEGPYSMEVFYSKKDVLMVPSVLTRQVRQCFPDAVWDFVDGRLYGSSNKRVVAVIGNGAREGW